MREIVRIATSGSIDDGKSTLIGRLLVDTGNIPEDHIDAVRRISNKKGLPDVDYALLLDGLAAEREQGITIDVAYRYMTTDRRRYVIADTPGHEQYVRNMVTGSSTANVLIVVLDVRKGVLTQTKRHLLLGSLLSIPHILIAVNKMDLVEFDRGLFEQICDEISAYAAKLRIRDLHFIPVSALRGIMVTKRGEEIPWYTGPTLLEYLENVYVSSDRNLIDFRLPVQMVVRPHQDFRGYAGRIESGSIAVGDEVTALPSGRSSRIKTIETFIGSRARAFSPQSIVVTLEEDLDVHRGTLLVRKHNVPIVSSQFDALLFWMQDVSHEPGIPYALRHGTRTVRGESEMIRYRMNIHSLHREPTPSLELNDIGRIAFRTHEPLPFDAYATNRATGSFVLIDEETNATAGAGLIIGGSQSYDEENEA